MVKGLGFNRRKSVPRRFVGGLLNLCFAAFACFSTWTPAMGSESAVACDVTTGASCKVLGVKTTATSATISWTEKEHGSSRYFCYGIGSPSKCALVSSRAKGTKDQVVTGLTPNTKYAYKFYGVHSGKTLSVVTGNFTAVDGYVCGSSVISTVEVDGKALTASGDSLEHVIAKIIRTSDKKEMGRDTTNPSGSFGFTVDPGSYTITVEYPPFTAPAPYNATVIINKALTVPDQILTGAFQVGGFVVVTSPKLDSIPGATVSLLNKSNNSVVATQVTDVNGHYSFGTMAGDYILKVTYQNLALQSPSALTVSKDTHITNLVMGAATGLRYAPAPWWNNNIGTKSGMTGYDAKGARNSLAPNSQPRIQFNAH